MSVTTDSPVLLAREARWEARQRLAAQHGRPVLSATLRLPYALRLEYVELLHAPVAHLPLTHVEFAVTADGPCLLGVADSPNMDARALKALALELEAASGPDAWGVLLDLDVMDASGRQLGREEHGLAPRRCLVCGANAKECVVARRHTTDDVRAVVETILHSHPVAQNDRAARIARLAHLAAEDEIRTHPKPGLVTPLSSGAHTDMDVFLFLQSCTALVPFFAHCAAAGAAWDTAPGPELLASLRLPGQAAERAMFAVTGGVNTHKGLLFAMGLVCCAAGYVGRTTKEGFSAEQVLDTVQALSTDLLAELSSITSAAGTTGGAVSTAGERLYSSLGVTGARGQAASGYAVVRRQGLPTLRAALASGADWNTARVRTLLALMAEAEDTNLLHRGGPEGLQLVRALAARALSVPWQEQGEHVTELECACLERRLSAGGCADLLALTLFLHRLETQGA